MKKPATGCGGSPEGVVGEANSPPEIVADPPGSVAGEQSGDAKPCARQERWRDGRLPRSDEKKVEML